MEDEKTNAEETAVEETQETNTEASDNGSEAEQNSSEKSGGDLKVALSQERDRYHFLQSQLEDPNFIYQRAVALGLAEQEQAAQNEAADDTQEKPAGMSYSDYQFYRSLEKAQEKYSDLSKNYADQMAISAIVNREGLSPEKAADKFYSRFNKVKEEAKAEGAKQQETTISEKEKAQTASGVAHSSDAAEMDELRDQIRSGDRVTSKNALAELVKKMDKKAGII